jgi:hypothetical protein
MNWLSMSAKYPPVLPAWLRFAVGLCMFVIIGGFGFGAVYTLFHTPTGKGLAWAVVYGSVAGLIPFAIIAGIALIAMLVLVGRWLAVGNDAQAAGMLVGLASLPGYFAFMSMQEAFLIRSFATSELKKPQLKHDVVEFRNSYGQGGIAYEVARASQLRIVVEEVSVYTTHTARTLTMYQGAHGEVCRAKENRLDAVSNMENGFWGRCVLKSVPQASAPNAIVLANRSVVAPKELRSVLDVFERINGSETLLGSIVSHQVPPAWETETIPKYIGAGIKIPESSGPHVLSHQGAIRELFGVIDLKQGAQPDIQKFEATAEDYLTDPDQDIRKEAQVALSRSIFRQQVILKHQVSMARSGWPRAVEDQQKIIASWRDLKAKTATLVTRLELMPYAEPKALARALNSALNDRRFADE